MVSFWNQGANITWSEIMLYDGHDFGTLFTTSQNPLLRVVSLSVCMIFEPIREDYCPFLYSYYPILIGDLRHFLETDQNV